MLVYISCNHDSQTNVVWSTSYIYYHSEITEECHLTEQSMCVSLIIFLPDNLFPNVIRETPDIHHAPVKPTNNQANAQF